MDVEPKRIDFYVLRNGKAPFERWLNGLRTVERGRVCVWGI
jgi:hypothetical protein